MGAHMGLQAVAVELDLVQPFAAARRRRLQRRPRRRDKAGVAGLLRLLGKLRFGKLLPALLRLLDPAGLGRPARRPALDLLAHPPGLHRSRPPLQYFESLFRAANDDAPLT